MQIGLHLRNEIAFKNGEDCQSGGALLRDDKAGWGGRLDLVAQRKGGDHH